MNPSEGPPNKRKAPGLATTGEGKQNSPNLPLGEVFVNARNEGHRALNGATMECLAALREFVEFTGGEL